MITTTSLQVEERLLSACMIGGVTTLAKVAALGVTVEVFSNQQCARFWAALVVAGGEDKKTAEYFVAHRAFGSEMPEEGLAELKRIAQIEPTSLYAITLARDVIGEFKRQRVVAGLTLALQTATTVKAWPDAWDETRPAIRAAEAAASANAESTSLDAICDAYVAEENNGKPPGKVGTAIKEVDHAFGLVAPGEVLVIAGRPGVGKTALALQMADALIKDGLSAMIVSLEMGSTSMLGRLAKQRAGPNGVALRGSQKSDYEHAKASRLATVPEIRKAKGRLHIFEVREVSSISRIEDRAALLASGPIPLDCIVIDYLQLVTPEDSRAPREQQVAQISRRVKLLALELNVPIILLSQLNRDAEKNGRAPRIGDLRESGAIEQDADRIWLLYPNPDHELISNSPSVPVRLEQAKNRNGESGISASLTFYKPTFSFVKK